LNKPFFGRSTGVVGTGAGFVAVVAAPGAVLFTVAMLIQ